MCLIALRNLLLHYPWGVDVVIPLKAATRWLAGGQPYLASSFLNGPGYDLPYLYPPFVLPFVAPFTGLPQTWSITGWFRSAWGPRSSPAAGWRSLAAIPFLFAWPPFTEGLLGGNVQVVLFAAFVALLWRGPRAGEDRGLISSRSSTTRPARPSGLARRNSERDAGDRRRRAQGVAGPALALPAPPELAVGGRRRDGASPSWP